MKIQNKVILGTLVGGGLLLGAAGVSLTYAQSNSQTSTNVFDRVAQILGVDSTKLSEAVKQAKTEEIDKLVKDGKLTQTEADKLKANVDDKSFGLGRPRHEMGMGGRLVRLDDLATYLNVDKADLMNNLGEGKSLKDYIISKGKTVEDASNYIYNKVKADLDARVKEGKITQEQEDKILANEKTRITDFLNGVRPEKPVGGKMKRD